MILNRYFLKTIFSYTLAISVVFILIIVSSRSIQYLEQASRGEINPQVVFYIVLYRLPEFLELILPLSFFMSIVLTIGKFSSESELAIMEQLGFSNSRIYSLLAIPAVIIALLIFFFSLVLSPGLDLRVKSLLEVESLEETFDTLLPGQFHKLNDSYLIYAKEKEDKGLNDVFLLAKDSTEKSNLIIVAEGLSANRSGNGDLNFDKGFSYSKKEPDEIFSVKFDNLKLKADFMLKTDREVNFEQQDSVDPLIWSSSISFMTLLSIFMAVPLSERSPRNGRYSKILPSLLIFSAYLGILLTFKGSETSNLISIFLVHLLFLVISILLNLYMIKIKS